MLVIRLQRTGRKGHAMFRIVVQNSRTTPTSGKVVAYLGSYDPHSKSLILDKEKASTFLNQGAQPTPRIVGILKSEKVKLPKWVNEVKTQKREVRNPDKRRSTTKQVEPEIVPETVKEESVEPITTEANKEEDANLINTPTTEEKNDVVSETTS